MKTAKEKSVLASEMAQIVPDLIQYMHPYIFEPIDVPPAQILAMVVIQKDNGCTLTMLKKEMHVSAPTVSGIADRLVKGGYVKRSVDVDDRRVKNVVLTKKGALVLARFRTNIFKRWQHIISKMPLKEAQFMVKSLRNITKGLSDGAM